MIWQFVAGTLLAAMYIALSRRTTVRSLCVPDAFGGVRMALGGFLARYGLLLIVTAGWLLLSHGRETIPALLGFLGVYQVYLCMLARHFLHESVPRMTAAEE